MSSDVRRLRTRLADDEVLVRSADLGAASGPEGPDEFGVLKVRLPSDC